MYAKKNSGMKVAATLLAIVLLISCAVGGTIAWLMDTSNNVTNTFVVGDIAIEMKEHTLDTSGNLTTTEVEANEEDAYKILPGTEQKKDPFVRFTKKSEACWLFVKIVEENNSVSGKSYKYVSYDINNAWKPVSGVDNVYYIEYDNVIAEQTVTASVLADTKVTYNQDLTKEELSVAATNQPKLIFTAYAVQKEAANDAAAAWALVQNNPA